MVALLEMYQGMLRAELNKAQTEQEYVNADSLSEALAIHNKM
ncbi:MAG: hypothetical protein U0175_30570 [Caldilineaceae bacterium]